MNWTNRKCGGGDIPRLRAFTLLEVLLALGVFVIAAVALSVALNGISVATLESADDLKHIEQLRSHLTEFAKSPNIQPGEFETLPDSNGVFYRTVIEQAEVANAAGEPLRGLFRIRVTVLQQLAQNNTPETIDEAEVLRYAPLF